MTPIELLQAAKRSVAAAIHFDLNSYCHCIAPHVCRAAGDTVVGEYVGDQHVAYRAWTLLGFHLDTNGKPVRPIPLSLFSGYLGIQDDRSVAYKRLDLAIEYLAAHSPAHTPEPEPKVQQVQPESTPEVLEEELIFA